MMLKLTRWALAGAIAAVALLPQTAWGELEPIDSAAPARPQDVPVCFMQTPDGRTLNLNRICGSSAQPNAELVSVDRPSLPSQPNLGGLQTIAETTGCFGLDAEGRPCPTP